MRLVVDPGVLIAAAVSRTDGAATVALIRAWQAGRVELVACERLVAEFEAVTQRPWFRERVNPPVSERLVADLRARATLVAAPMNVPAVCRDPHDDYLVALARTSHADALVSGDDDLMSLELPDVAILTPREVVDRLD